MSLLSRALTAIVVLMPATAWAQSAPSAHVAGEDSLAVPSLAVGRLAPGETIRVDGRLDEAAWAAAPVATGFVQLEPMPGEPVSERTEARILAGPRALYVAVTAYVRDPATLVRRLARRDEVPASDRVVVEFGSPADRRTAYSFGVTLAGVQHDALIYDDTYEDFSWDAVWESAVAPLPAPEAGYVVEFRIPYAQLRYDARRGGPWDLQIQRDLAATGERTFWAPIRPDREGYVSQFGTLTGLPALRPPRRVEVVPYVATRLTRAAGDAADPFYRATDVQPAVGLDARVGVTSGLTLTATINPDFGQVEADPAVVNLSQFEVFFDERRPFFVEGTDVFAFGAARGPSAAERPTLFYSRRIGGAPTPFGVLYPDTSFVWLTAPGQTTIAAAGKLSGQVGGWTVGLLDAVTTRETARYTAAGLERALPVATATNYLVGRARRSALGGRRMAGGFVSSVLRDTGPEAFATRLPATATLAGVDGEWATAGRAWTFSGVAVGSAVSGSADVISALQHAPQRYLQRPDAGHLALDPAATSMRGYRVEGAASRTAGTHWRGGLTLAATSPGFEANDLGFQLRADLVSADASVEYRVPRPRAPWLNFALFQLSTSQGVTFGGEHVVSSVLSQARARFAGLWETQLIGVARPYIYNDRLTRGGPLAGRPADVNLTWYTGTNRARRVAGAFTLAARGELPHRHAEVGREWTLRLRPTLYVQPTEALALAFEPVWTRAFNTDQYLGTRAAADGLAVDGRRYLFADTDIATLAAGLRADWAFAPGLTLQLVAVPQVDAVSFGGFRELARAGTYDFVRYGASRGSATPVVVGDDGTETPAAPGQAPDRYRIDPGDGDEPFAIPNLDFTRLSLRGNAVLRWEWRPGSTLFAVWQQVRDETQLFDGFGVVSTLPDALAADAVNVFLVKATYWFGL